METTHKSVLYKEALWELAIKPGRVYIDSTLDGGGHTKGILEQGAKVLAIDIDPQTLKHAAKDFSLKSSTENETLVARDDKLTVVHGNFANIREIAQIFRVWETPGILFDLGLSSDQLQDAKRGFSFSKAGPLDMRMDPTLKVTAADLINGLNEGELNDLFNKYGEDRSSRRIARAIVAARVKGKIDTTLDLAKVIESVSSRKEKIHPATRIFQALRIVVNDELNNLKKGLEGAVPLLEKNGRLVVISFHSLEDRIVKDFFRAKRDLEIITKKPITASTKEVLENPRARSAKMRVAQKAN
ncbi:16S rRNA (cytosine(1402)-N(4))-methyltransferase RsmH [Patescibacteria group bacterium]|nr:16S rRNA (cytosine(1402)-N(4))-methyltransferase RsmH [Patescibacteria group bacterium]